MTRVGRLKLGYLFAVILCIAFAILMVRSLSNYGPWALLAVVIVLLVPGRITGIFFRDLFRGIRLMQLGRSAEALASFESFRQSIRVRPWRKKLLWLTWSCYTVDVEAMVLNNIGITNMNLGKFAEASAALHDALRIDPLYPLPYGNLALLHSVEGDSDAARQAIETAKRLGYAGDLSDAAVRALSATLARIESGGIQR